MFATLVAGHDTTAYTMQFLLMQLARDQPLQHRVRAEALKVFAAIRDAGGAGAGADGGLTFADLPRFELLTKCIAETLRLWNVAPLVFPRVTSTADEVQGVGDAKVQIPAGTKFTFWFYGTYYSLGWAGVSSWFY